MNRTVLVTGASSGIGEATVQQLLKNQFDVVGLARDFSDTVVESDRFEKVEMDFSDIDKLPDLLKALSYRYSNISDLVCCAGQGRFGSLEEFSYNQIKSLMDINFLSQAFTVRAFLPQIKRLGGGNVVFMGSEAALSGGRRGAIYSASKFALRGFAQSLREECAQNSVRIGILNPGMVRTGFFDELDFSHGENTENYIEAQDVAEVIVWMLSSRPETVIDEVNLSPLKKVISKKFPKK